MANFYIYDTTGTAYKEDIIISTFEVKENYDFFEIGTANTIIEANDLASKYIYTVQREIDMKGGDDYYPPYSSSEDYMDGFKVIYDEAEIEDIYYFYL